jgi:hypothetical protein
MVGGEGEEAAAEAMVEETCCCRGGALCFFGEPVAGEEEGKEARWIRLALIVSVVPVPSVACCCC